MVTTRRKASAPKSLPNVSSTAAPENPETDPCPSSGSLLPEAASTSVNKDADDKLCSGSPDYIIPNSTSLSEEGNSLESNLDVPTPMDTDDEGNLTQETVVSELKLEDRENAENMPECTESLEGMPVDKENTAKLTNNPGNPENAEDTLVKTVNADNSIRIEDRENAENMPEGTESLEGMPVDKENTAKLTNNPGNPENAEDTLVKTVNADNSITSTSQDSGKCLNEPFITNLGSEASSVNNSPCASFDHDDSVLLQSSKVPLPSTLQCQNSVSENVKTPDVLSVTQNLECTGNAQDVSCTQHSSSDNMNNITITSAVTQSQITSSAPMTSAKTKQASFSNKVLVSITGCEISSDSEEESVESESDVSNIIPSVSDSLEMHVDTAGDQDVVIIAPPSKEVNKPPQIDLASADYRNIIDIASGTDDSESDSESSSSSTSSLNTSSDDSESSLSDIEVITSENTKNSSKEPKRSESRKPLGKKKNTCLAKGELSLEDLPPIADLKISVPETLAHVIGFVFNVVEQQVIVQGHHGIPPIDLDSVLFLDNGQRALGQIFDVFGPVQEPLYVVRFNSANHVKENNVNKGDLVYYAPNTEHTSFVVLDELMRIKGSDASGLSGNEILPSEMTDFSDDEEEARVKGHSKNNKYESSTSEFQSNRKRNCNRARGNEKRGGNRGQARGVGRGSGPMHNPFREHGKRPRPMHHQPGYQPRFDPRGSPGPSRIRERPNGHWQGSPHTMNRGDFGPQPFSQFANQDDVKSYQNGSTQGNPPWSQPPPAQFGGPPQFSRHAPPPTPPPQPYPAFSSGVQNNGLPVSSFPPPFSPRPPHSAGSFQNMAPPPPSSFPPAESPRPYHQTNGYQNMIPQTPPPSSPSYMPRPDAYTGMGHPVGAAMPPRDGNINGGWFNPDSVHHPPPSSSSHHPVSHPPPPSSHVMTSRPLPYSHMLPPPPPPPSHPPPHSSMPPPPY